MPAALKDALQPPANGWNNQSAWNPAVDTVADILRECEASGLLEDLRAALGCAGEDHHVVTLRAIRDLVYELAGSENRDLAVDVLIYATGRIVFARVAFMRSSSVRRDAENPSSFCRIVIFSISSCASCLVSNWGRCRRFPVGLAGSAIQSPEM
jgi:hypothetical protein